MERYPPAVTEFTSSKLLLSSFLFIVMITSIIQIFGALPVNQAT